MNTQDLVWPASMWPAATVDNHRARTDDAVAAPLIVEWASSWRDVRQAQRLRYRVFAEELGARVPSRLHQLDADEFDASPLGTREGRDGHQARLCHAAAERTRNATGVAGIHARG